MYLLLLNQSVLSQQNKLEETSLQNNSMMNNITSKEKKLNEHSHSTREATATTRDFDIRRDLWIRQRYDIVEQEKLRFSKIFFSSDIIETHGNLDRFIKKPLSKKDYPISGSLANTLRMSLCPSVLTLDDSDLEVNIFYLISKLGGCPTHPENKDSDYWDRVRELLSVRKQRIENPKVVPFPVPDAWNTFDLSYIANAVHNEVRLVYEILIGLYFPFGFSKFPITMNI